MIFGWAGTPVGAYLMSCPLVLLEAKILDPLAQSPDRALPLTLGKFLKLYSPQLNYLLKENDHSRVVFEER